MPAFLIPILESMAPTLIEWGLSAIERKYPGLRNVIETLISKVAEAPSQSDAVKAANAHVQSFSIIQPNDLKATD